MLLVFVRRDQKHQELGLPNVKRSCKGLLGQNIQLIISNKYLSMTHDFYWDNID